MMPTCDFFHFDCAVTLRRLVRTRSVGLTRGCLTWFRPATGTVDVGLEWPCRRVGLRSWRMDFLECCLIAADDELQVKVERRNEQERTTLSYEESACHYGPPGTPRWG
jgi:hypothetical protein